MTDTVADPAVTPTSAQAEVTVSAVVADSVRAQLADRGIPDTAEIVLFDLDPCAGVSVGRMDPARGTVADSYSDSGLTLDALDHVIAEHLIRVGRVAAPTSRDWHEEVLDLVTRGRERLRDSDGTFLMGRDHIRLFRMARRDVAEAGAPLTARAEELARAAVAGAAAPAVVITGRVSAWPGLRDAVARAVPVPVVDAEPAGSAIRPVATGGHAAEPDEGAGDGVPVWPAPTITSEREHTTDSHTPNPSPGETVRPDKGDDPPHDPPIFEAVKRAPPPMATAFGALATYGAVGQPIREDPPNGGPAYGGGASHDGTDTASGSSSATRSLSVAAPFIGRDVDTAPASGSPPDDSAPTGPLQLVDVPTTGPQTVGAGRRRGGKRVLAGIALLCAVAVVGVATALAVAHDEPAPTVAAPLPQRTIVTPEPEFADPAILAEARQPARRYTTPPPPETTTPSSESAPRPRPRSRTPRAPGGVTIPIPGLPPIVLP